MQPYQKAEQKIRASGEGPINLVKNAGLTIAGAGAAKFGASALGSLIPKVGALISKYIPDDLSRKGLEKVDPRFKKFIQGAMNEGFDYDEIRNFIGEQVEKTEQKRAIQAQNIIQQYSPELHQFIDQEIKKGRKPIEAGALAQNDKKFTNIIKKLTKDHKTPWSSILESVYGGGQTAQPEQQQQQMQPSQNGAGDEQIAAALQKILQM